jgi:hypothetical protein
MLRRLVGSSLLCVLVRRWTDSRSERIRLAFGAGWFRATPFAVFAAIGEAAGFEVATLRLFFTPSLQLEKVSFTFRSNLEGPTISGHT